VYPFPSRGKPFQTNLAQLLKQYRSKAECPSGDFIRGDSCFTTQGNCFFKLFQFPGGKTAIFSDIPGGIFLNFTEYFFNRLNFL
jgi:hypothetical protein